MTRYQTSPSPVVHQPYGTVPRFKRVLILSLWAVCLARTSLLWRSLTPTRITTFPPAHLETVDQGPRIRSQTKRSNTNIDLFSPNNNISTVGTVETLKEEQHNQPRSIKTPTKTNNHNDKPWFVLHVGPPKTYSTTIQCQLYAWRGALAQDGYTYFGPCGGEQGTAATRNQLGRQLYYQSNLCHVQLFQAQQQQQASNNDTTVNWRDLPCWKAFTAELQRFISSRPVDQQHVILSNEIFSFAGQRRKWHWPALKEALEEHWNVKVVVSYRRYWEWLPSVQAQRDKEAHVGLNWPHNVIDKPMSDTIWEQIMILQQQSTPYGYYYTDAAVARLSQVFDQVQVLNLHNETEPFMTQLLCDLVPGAPHSCRTARENSKANLHKNAATRLEYDAIARRAVQLGILDPSLISRREAEKRLEYYHQNNHNQPDWPRACPTQAQAQGLLEQSLQREMKLLPFTSKNAREEHIVSFWKAFDTGHFCSWNVSEVAQLVDWTSEPLFQHMLKI